MVKNSPAMWIKLGFAPWVGKIPGRGHGNPLQHRSLAGFSSCNYKESDTTEGLSTAQHMYYPIFIIIIPGEETAVLVRLELTVHWS